MPVTVKMTFPSGRFHATPWGRHVNEGVPEWPPSPWRLLRALVAVWKRTCSDVPEERVKRVLTALAAPPLFHLPRHTVAHTRHAMPMNIIAKNYRPSDAERKAGRYQGDPSIVFDTFVSVARTDPLYVHWPATTLAVEDEVTLRRLVGNLTSFGRAEGWVETEVVSFPEGTSAMNWNCQPAAADEPNPTPVLCADAETAFADDHYPTHDPKKLQRGQVNPKEFLFDCPRWHLCLDTQTIHAERWPRVPGARWVNYAVRSPEVEARLAVAPRRPQPTVARFLLDGPVLPLGTDTVRVAEAFRHETLVQYQRYHHRQKYGNTEKPYREQFRSPALSGKDAAGVPLLSHDHAHYLPTAEGDDRRRITHLTVYAPGGLGLGEQAALTSLRAIRVGDGEPLRVQLVGLGRPEDFTACLFRSSAVWVSVTPFVAHRHPKLRGSKKDTPHLTGPDPKAAFVELAIRELVTRRGLGRLVEVERLPTACGGLRSTEFRRSRERDGEEGWRRPHGLFVLRFDSPVPGPVSLGYASHYGLGLFQPG